MEQINTMEWSITLLSAHIVLLAGIIGLFKGAPCWLQRTAMGLLFLGAVFFVAAYLAALIGVSNWYYILLIAFVFEHLAVCVYVFRMYVNNKGETHGRADRTVAEVR